MTLEEYLTAIRALEVESESRGAALQLESDDNASLEELKADLEAYFEPSREILDDFASRLAGLDPPDEAEDVHAQYEEGTQGASDALDDWIQAAHDAKTTEDLVKAAGSFVEAVASQGFDERCTELQELADDARIDVDFDCEV